MGQLVVSVLIEDALREIGVLRETESASAEQAETGLRKLNQLLAAYAKGGPALDSYPVALDDEVVIDAGDELGITSRLAILLAPLYGATASAELVANAQEFVTKLEAQALMANLRELQFRGMGGGGAIWDITTDKVS